MAANRASHRQVVPFVPYIINVERGMDLLSLEINSYMKEVAIPLWADPNFHKQC